MTQGSAPAWRRYLRFWRSNAAADFDDELEFHIEERVDEYMACGMSADDARRKAVARLGDVDAARAECVVLGQLRDRRDRRADFFDGLRADVRFAHRSLRRSPGWTAVAPLTIALGVGATTTVFSACIRVRSCAMQTTGACIRVRSCAMQRTGAGTGV